MDRLSSAAYDCKNHILHRQAYIGIAKSIASITKAFNDLEKANKLIIKLYTFLLSDSEKTVENDSIKLFAILTLGEVGRIYYEAFINTNIEYVFFLQIIKFNFYLDQKILLWNHLIVIQKM